MAKISAIMLFNWVVIACSTFSVTLGLSTLPVSVYLSLPISGLLDIPVTILYLRLVDRKPFGRRNLINLAFLVGGCATLLSVAFAQKTYCLRNDPDKFKNGYVILGTILVIVSKSFYIGGYATMYTYSSELYPTEIRTTALGVFTLAEAAGAMLSPVLLVLYDVRNWLPGTIFGVLSVMMGLLGFILPKTLGQNMPNTMRESRLFHEKELQRRASLVQRKLSFVFDAEKPLPSS